MTTAAKNILVGLGTIFFKVLLSDLLGEAGHAVSFAKDGTRLCDALRQSPDGVDLLMLDMLDPGVKGYEVLHWINENGYHEKFPVMAITGVCEPTLVVEKLKSMGVRGMISRSLTPEQILQRVNGLLLSDKAAPAVPRIRVPVTIPVEFTFDRAAHHGTILNISEGGTCLYADVKMPMEAQVGLRFTMPGLEKVINARGVVRWSPSENKEALRGHGLMFTWISDADLELLRRFITEESTKFNRLIGG
ncbi:MAG: PilZ domain-containing protein [Deltaproteobacteria bacterium]|nr:PilZ domain-containing protein [Deltaproteobacteria bacterium]